MEATASILSGQRVVVNTKKSCDFIKLDDLGGRTVNDVGAGWEGSGSILSKTDVGKELSKLNPV